MLRQYHLTLKLFSFFQKKTCMNLLKCDFVAYSMDNRLSLILAKMFEMQHFVMKNWLKVFEQSRSKRWRHLAAFFWTLSMSVGNKKNLQMVRPLTTTKFNVKSMAN